MIRKILLSITILTLTKTALLTEANLDYFRSDVLMDVTPHYWSRHNEQENSTYLLGTNVGCTFCAGAFYNEPPPDEILFMPPPPMHPNFQGGLAEMINSVDSRPQNEQCNFCNLFPGGGEQLLPDGSNQAANHRIVAALIAFLTISTALIVYLVGTRKSKIITALTRTRLFKSNQPVNTVHNIAKNSSLNQALSNSGVHLSDPCYLQTNRDKNLTSPIISDHISHKKTSIPSKYWTQPGSIIGRTIRRIPNEYEVPSSQTNSTGTSSAVYGDVNNENGNHRFFSPYNLHTYSEVREVLDPNDHFHASSNSSVMMSESNYDNAVYNHGNCVINGGSIVSATPNGSVQMSDFNSIRPVQSYGQHPAINIHQHQLNQPKFHQQNTQPIYEQAPQRAQIIITSNNQGVNPSLLNYKERIHNVI